jgi:hypothetical protein
MEERVMRSLPLVVLICGCLAPSAGCKKETGASAVAAAETGAPAITAAELGQAVAAAQTWLKLVDNGQFDQSWDSASPMIQLAAAKGYWSQKMVSVQGMFGKLVSRELISKTPRTSLPGAPYGTYVVIQYRTNFAKKSGAIETITPKLEKDGTWKVSGYYVK